MCTKENGPRYSVQLFADCFRLRGKYGGVSRFYSVISSPRRKEGMLHVASISQGATQQKTVGCPNFSIFTIKDEATPHVIINSSMIFRVDMATYGSYCLDLCYLYSISNCFRYLKSEEIELLIAFICCCFDTWVMGQSCPKVNFTFQICELS